MIRLCTILEQLQKNNAIEVVASALRLDSKKRS
jgi:hypothetical protein